MFTTLCITGNVGFGMDWTGTSQILKYFSYRCKIVMLQEVLISMISILISCKKKNSSLPIDSWMIFHLQYFWHTCVFVVWFLKTLKLNQWLIVKIHLLLFLIICSPADGSVDRKSRREQPKVSSLDKYMDCLDKCMDCLDKWMDCLDKCIDRLD